MMSPILSASGAPVTVELLGLARHRAGWAAVGVVGRIVADVLRAVTDAFPGLAGHLCSGAPA